MDLINLAHTLGYINNGHNCVRMSNGEELAVARNRKKAFWDLFDKLDKFIQITKVVDTSYL